MEQNNFEKQVQKKMEELIIHPSESAWNNIEKRIAQKKDRKRLIFIISIFLFLVILTGFYLDYNPWKTISEPKSERSAIVNNKVQKNNSSIEKPDQLNKNSIKETKKSEKKYAELNLKNFNSKIQHPQKINKKSILKNEIPSVDFHKESQTANELVNDNEIKNSENSLDAPSSGRSTAKADTVNEINSNHINVESTLIKKEEENSANKSASKKQIKDTIAVIESPEIPASKKEKSNWNLGIAFTGGTSFAGNVPLSINKSADFLSSPVTSGGSPNQNNFMPSKARNSLAFTSGVFIQKNIFVKSKISIGLNYKYFSTKNKVGNKFDSVLTNYYSANPLNNFHNKFHFLEIPVTFKFRLNPNKSLPFYWNVGVSISQLISTTALQFKSDQGIYYRDNSLFNKTQLGLNMGFSATLFSKSKSPVNVGPYFYYDATKISNKGLYNKTHFSFIGISAEILLNKK